MNIKGLKLAYFLVLLCSSSILKAQNTIEIKLNPFFWAEQLMPTLSFEKIAPNKHTSWEAGLMLNNLGTCTVGLQGNNLCHVSLYKNYLYAGAYGAFRWYPFAKPGQARWLFIGAMAAYGGGILMPSEVRLFFNGTGNNPNYVYQHNQKQLFLGPLGGVKLMAGKRFSLEGLVFISPYYRKITFTSQEALPFDGSFGVNLGYRIFKHRKID